MLWLYWALSLLVALGAGYMVYRADAKTGVPYPWITAVLRSVIWLLVALLLLAPTINTTKHEVQKPVIVFLQDNSESISEALKSDTAQYRQSVSELVRQLEAQYRVDVLSFGGDVQRANEFDFSERSTDISSAIEKVGELYADQNLGAVILASDGRFNQGRNPLYQSDAIAVPVYTVGIGDTVQQRDLFFGKVYANNRVAQNSRFEVRADVLAHGCQGHRGVVRLLHNGEVVAVSDIVVGTDRYDASFSFQLKAAGPGVHHYVIELSPAQDEHNLLNNRRDVFVEVIEEKKKILIVGDAPHPDIRAIREALAQTQRYEIVVSANGRMPEDLTDYDAVVVHNMPVSPAVGNKLRNTPVWIIVGDRMPSVLLNQLQQSAEFGPGGAVREVSAQYNPSFYQFVLPADVKVVADKLPPLFVGVSSIQLAPSSEVLFQQTLSGSERLPLWWLQQGSRPVVVLAGTGLWRWRMYEYRYFKQHAVVDECIRQTVSFLTTNGREESFQTVVPKHVWSDFEPVIVQAILLNSNNEPFNTPDVYFVLTDSAGYQQNYAFERSGSAYRVNLGVLPAGSYTYTASTVYQDKTHTDKGRFVVTSTSPELMETGADYALLFGMAHQYGGAFLPWHQLNTLTDTLDSHPQIQPVIKTTTESSPLVDRKWYFFVVLVVAAAEWLLRKYWMAM